MSDIKEFVGQLNLPIEGKWDNDTYTIKMTDSGQFSKIYNRISNDEQFKLEDQSISTTDNALFTFYTEWYNIVLTADFNKDIYRMVVSRR